VDVLREESRVRRVVTQILWERGSATPEEIEELTRQVMEQRSGR
jgi:hypothetical protein